MPRWTATIVMLAVGWACLGPFPAAAHVVGIEFVEDPFYSPLLGLVPWDNVFPFQFTDPANHFSAQGALEGVGESDVQRAIVRAVQRIFRRAEIDQAGQMLHVDIRWGAVDPAVGTTHAIGSAGANLNLFGTAYPTGATFRPDLNPGSVYTNQLSLTLVDTVDRIPQFDPDTTFQTLEQVVQAVAGTAAHEIAHTLNVWNHVPAEPVEGVYPIMATGPTGLPVSERLRERRFLDIPDTQPSQPGPPAGGPLIYSVTETLQQAAGRTAVSDFNFDGAVDGSDLEIWSTQRFQVGTSVSQGDANDDGVTDVSDFNQWNSQRIQGEYVGSARWHAEPAGSESNALAAGLSPCVAQDTVLSVTVDCHELVCDFWMSPGGSEVAFRDIAGDARGTLSSVPEPSGLSVGGWLVVWWGVFAVVFGARGGPRRGFPTPSEKNFRRTMSTLSRFI